MDIRIREENNTAILELSGNIDDNGAHELERTFDEELCKGVNKLVFDLSCLEDLSNIGLRALLMGHKHFKGNVVIKNVNSNVKEVFERTGFDSTFNFE